jgi:nitrate reductase alpha subunit
LTGRPDYFDDYCRTYSDMPFLVMLEEKDGQYVPGRMLRASDFADGLGQDNNPDWKTVAIDENTGNVVVPNGSIGFRWGEEGQVEYRARRECSPAKKPDRENMMKMRRSRSLTSAISNISISTTARMMICRSATSRT